MTKAAQKQQRKNPKNNETRCYITNLCMYKDVCFFIFGESYESGNESLVS